MTRWDCELVNRLRHRFWMTKSISTDDEVLETTAGSLARALIVFRMNVECLWASMIGRHAPWMED